MLNFTIYYGFASYENAFSQTWGRNVFSYCVRYIYVGSGLLCMAFGGGFMDIVPAKISEFTVFTLKL
mgnify:CR=1 FL=1